MKLQVYATIDNQRVPYASIEVIKSFEAKSRTQLHFSESYRSYTIDASDMLQDIHVTHDSILIETPMLYYVSIEHDEHIREPEMYKEKDKYVIVRDEQDFSKKQEMINNIAACASFIMRKPALFWLGRVGFRIGERYKRITVILNKKAVYETT